MVDTDRDAALDELEALAGRPIPGLRNKLGGLLPHEFAEAVAYWRVELPRAFRQVAIQEAHAPFIRERETRAAALGECFTKVIAGPNGVLEEPVPVVADPRMGSLSEGQWSVLDTDSCRRATPLPGRERFREFLRSIEHLPLRLEPFSEEEEGFCNLHRAPHPGALIFAGIKDVRKVGLTPCRCRGDPAKHRFQVKDVQLSVAPFVWGPGAEFDLPCPEAEQDVSASVRVGHVVDRLAKRPKEPEAPPPPTAERVLKARMAELDASVETWEQIQKPLRLEGEKEA